MKKTLLMIFIITMTALIFGQEFPLNIINEEQSNLSWNFNNIIQDSTNIICYTKNFEQSSYLFLQFVDFNGDLKLGEQGVLIDSTYIGDIVSYHVSTDLNHNIYVA